MDNTPDKTTVQMTVYELTAGDVIKLGVILATTTFVAKVALNTGARLITPKIRQLTARMEAKKPAENLQHGMYL